MNLQSHASRYGISLLAVSAAFAIANVYDYFQYRCTDCYVSYGVPFIFLQDGGWVPRRILWDGVAADLAGVAVLTAIIGWTWSRFANNNRLKK